MNKDIAEVAAEMRAHTVGKAKNPSARLIAWAERIEKALGIHVPTPAAEINRAQWLVTDDYRIVGTFVAENKDMCNAFIHKTAEDHPGQAVCVYELKTIVRSRA